VDASQQKGGRNGALARANGGGQGKVDCSDSQRDALNDDKSVLGTRRGEKKSSSAGFTKEKGEGTRRQSPKSKENKQAPPKKLQGGVKYDKQFLKKGEG